MATKQILEGLTVPIKGKDLVWGGLNVQPAPADDTPISDLMYAIVRFKRASYTRKEYVGILLKHFKNQGFNSTPEKIYEYDDKVDKLIAAANNINPNSFSTGAQFKAALKALSPIVTDGMVDDWIANLKDFWEISTFAELQAKYPAVEP